MQDTATFAGGCFWCLEAAFQRLPGVLKVESGYCGGQAEWPTYQQVCRGDTGHAGQSGSPLTRSRSVTTGCWTSFFSCMTQLRPTGKAMMSARNTVRPFSFMTRASSRPRSPKSPVWIQGMHLHIRLSRKPYRPDHSGWLKPTTKTTISLMKKRHIARLSSVPNWND